ncbi:glycoside hydrolase family 35 protein [Sarocladium strictum]
MHSILSTLALSALQGAVLLTGQGAEAMPHVSRQEHPANSSIVTWDDHSLMINGERLQIYAAEVHGFRYPGYSSWVEVFQKFKAAGFNTISTYFFWGMIEHKRGEFNWDGVRDPQAFFDAAKEVGLYVISRPGPYINAEVSSGGFPGWLQRIEGPARNSGEEYTKAYMPYLTQVFEVTARNQIDRGGPVIALQLENEYDEAIGGEDKEYGRILKQTAIDAGITVPTTHNGGLNLKLGNYLIDNVEIWGYDEYPATRTTCPGPDVWPADAIKQFQWSEQKSDKFNRGQPMAIFEFEGGFKQSWGDAGYCGELASIDFQKMFYKNKYAMATTIFSIYMAWGGTNWGNLASPDCYTSYDFGAMITEDRRLRSKYYEAKLHAHFLRASPAFLTAWPQNIDGNEMAYVEASDESLTVTMSLDMEGKKTKFFFARHTDASYLKESEYTLTLPTSEGNITVPQIAGKLSLRGRDTKIHVVDYQVGDYSLLYSTAEVFTSLKIDGVTVLLLYGDHGQLHETAITTAADVPLTVFGDRDDTKLFNVTSTKSSQKSKKNIVLNYRTTGKSAVRIGDDLLVYILDRETAYQAWPDLENNSLVFGGYLVRSAKASDKTLKVVGDLNATTTFEFVAPSSARSFTFNGRRLTTISTKYGTKTATVEPRLPDVNLPDLKGLTWKAADSLPELSGQYDDSKWTKADLESTTNPNKPETPVSLYAGDYGYHTGHILWRGHFKALGGETNLSLAVHGGNGFAYSVFDNGALVNSFHGAKNTPSNEAAFALAAPWKKGEDHVITVLQDHMGYSMSWTANTELYKQARGISGYNLTSSDGTIIEHKDVTWKVQGNLGGEDYIDKTRGPFNEGGLYGERLGWHLPRFPDSNWETSSPFDGIQGAGIKFFRSTFDLNIGDNVDYPISIQAPNIAPNDAPYRALIYVNGYQFGRYSSTLGPQTRFPIPPSIIDLKGKNTLVVALWSLSDAGAFLPSLSMNIDARIDYGGPKFRKESAPPHKASERKAAL